MKFLETFQFSEDKNNNFQSKEINAMTSRQLKALETKKNIYESAIKLFGEKGFHNVTIDEIVNLAGTSKGSFYTYFKTKNHVFLEQFKEYDKQYIIIYNNLSDYSSAQSKLLDFVKEMYAYIVKSVGLNIIKAIYTNGYEYTLEESSFITNESRPLYKIVYEIIREGKKNDEFKDEYSDQFLTRMVVRCLIGTYYDWCLYEGSFNLVEDGTSYFSVFLDGIKKI